MYYKESIVKAYFMEVGLPEPVFEYRYIPDRLFRLDVAFPEHKIGIEVQGGLWMKAAHTTGKGIKRDMEKRNLGILNGWRVIEVVPENLCMETTVDMLKQLMGVK